MARFDAPARRPRVLILDGHSKAAAACVVALAHDCEVDVASSRVPCVAQASPRVAERLLQPDNPEQLIAWVQALHERVGYDLIVPATEAALAGLKSHNLSPELRARMVLADEASLDIALDKHRTWAVAKELGIPVPDGTVVERGDPLPPAPRYPVVIKPLSSKKLINGRVQPLDVRICADAAERAAAYRELLPHTAVMEQSYFGGRGVGVEMLFEHGEPRWTFAHQRVHEMPVTGGASTYRRAIRPPEGVRAAAVALLRRLRWHGAAMVEFKVAEDGSFRLMEINPRLWGSLPLAVAAGVNFPRGLLDLAMGRPLAPQPRYRQFLHMRDLGADLQWFAQSRPSRVHPLAVKKLGLDDVLGLLRPLAGLERWDLFSWREPQMWVALTRTPLRELAQGLRRRVGLATASAASR